MSRTPPRTLTVLARQTLTPNMLRITLGGPGLHDFPADQVGGYIKLRFAQPGSTRPLLRTYTVRHQRADAIDVDFVRHAHGGPAARWAETALPGATIDIGGPGAARRPDPTADWFLFAGDMTALPAIFVHIEALPHDAHGHAVLEVLDAADIQALKAPAGLAINWLVNPEPGAKPGLLADAVRDMPWPSGRPSVWAACEFTAMRELRTHLRDERGLPAEQRYVSSYWQLGSDETHHKAVKRADAEADS